VRARGHPRADLRTVAHGRDQSNSKARGEDCRAFLVAPDVPGAYDGVGGMARASTAPLASGTPPAAASPAAVPPGTFICSRP
jgi:hypothetical protein